MEVDFVRIQQSCESFRVQANRLQQKMFYLDSLKNEIGLQSSTSATIALINSSLDSMENEYVVLLKMIQILEESYNLYKRAEEDIIDASPASFAPFVLPEILHTSEAFPYKNEFRV